MKLVLVALIGLLAGCGVPIQCPKGDLRGICTAFFPDAPPVTPDRAEEIARLEAQIATLTELIVASGAQSSALNDELNSLKAELASAQLGQHIVEIVDPCGKQANYDEVLLRSAAGLYLAWYLDRGLVIVPEGVCFVTTDGTGCRFVIKQSVVHSQNGSCPLL